MAWRSAALGSNGGSCFNRKTWGMLAKRGRPSGPRRGSGTDYEELK
jgi:hypothetical protein